MGLQVSDIADDVQAIQQDLGELKATDLMHDLQRFYAMPRILKKNRVHFTVGEQIRRNIVLNHGGNAQHTSLYAVDDTHRRDVLSYVLVPWRHGKTHWIIDRREVNMNRNPRKVVDLVKLGRQTAMASAAELLESDFWGAPSSSSDDLTPWGLFYWCVKSATAADFNGQNPSGFSSVGGLDTSTAAYARFRNYAGPYVAITKADLVQKMRTAYRKIQFVSPTRMPNYSTGTDYEIFTNDAVFEQFEVLVEGQNENIGNDLGGRNVTFKGNPVHWVPSLDSDSTDPVYFINWGTFKIEFLRGEYMVENPPKPAPNQHPVLENWIDWSFNFVDVDRRGLAVLSK